MAIKYFKKGGVTQQTNSVIEEARLKRAGFKEVSEQEALKTDFAPKPKKAPAKKPE